MLYGGLWGAGRVGSVGLEGFREHPKARGELSKGHSPLGSVPLQHLPVPTGARPCSPKYFGRDSMVCVCNATYCDTLDPVVLPAPGTYVKYESSKAGKRLERSEGSFQRSLRAPGTCCVQAAGAPAGLP